MLDSQQETEAVVRTLQSRLRERLQQMLGEVSPPLRRDIEVALSARGKLLSSNRSATLPQQPAMLEGVWPLLTLLIAHTLVPDADMHMADQSALAIECQICAFDILDDVEDGDISPTLQALGLGRGLNVATALLILAQRALCSPNITGTFPAETENHLHLRGQTLWNLFIQESLVACGGQHSDLLSESQPVEQFQLEDGLAIAAAKAGSLMRVACLLGAVSVEAPENICTCVAELGLNLGIAHQLNNDAHDLQQALKYSSQDHTLPLPLPQSIKSDLYRQKKTLPVILAAIQQTTLQKTVPPVDIEWKELLQDGITATWSLFLHYRTRVRGNVKLLETLLGRPLSPALLYLLNVGQ